MDLDVYKRQSRGDGVKKTIEFLRPLMIDAPYEGRSDALFTK